jgi:hypothetical protein
MLPKLLLLYKLAQQCEKGKQASIASAAHFPFTMNEIKRSFAQVAMGWPAAGWLASTVVGQGGCSMGIALSRHHSGPIQKRFTAVSG